MLIYNKIYQKCRRQRKRVKPNKCKKLRGCKVARGNKRTFCRKARNKTNKKRGTYKENEYVVEILV